MLIDSQVAVAIDLQTESSVFRNLLQHVVVETDAGLDLDRVCGVKIHCYADGGFIGRALYRTPPASGAQRISDVGP
jgi:hypothetical protein